ncbi:hypothetical protein JCM6882_003589 [Rhodosporidiobolus microsporus]
MSAKPRIDWRSAIVQQAYHDACAECHAQLGQGEPPHPNSMFWIVGDQHMSLNTAISALMRQHLIAAGRGDIADLYTPMVVRNKKTNDHRAAKDAQRRTEGIGKTTFFPLSAQ